MNSVLAAVLVIPLLLPGVGPEWLPAPVQAVRIGDVPLIPNTDMTPPIALVHPRPVLSLEAFQAGVEGKITFRAEFDIEGNFEVLEILDNPGFGLEEAARRALEGWRFRPAYGSRRVSVIAQIDVAFGSDARFGFVEQFWLRR